MGNCLITKLKGIVLNENLPKYGEMIIDVNQNVEGDNRAFGLHSASEELLTVTSIGGNFYLNAEDYHNLTNGYTTLTQNAFTDIFLDSNVTKIKITSKYSRFLLYNGYCILDLKDSINYSNCVLLTTKYSNISLLNIPLINTVTFNECYGNLDEFINKSPNINYIYINNVNHRLALTLDILYNKNIYSISTWNTNIIGNSSDIYRLEHLNEFHLDYPGNGFIGNYQDLAVLNYRNNINELFLGTSILGGSIQEFVDACIANGKTSGSVVTPHLNSNANIYCDRQHTVLYSGSEKDPGNGRYNTLHWTSDGNWNVSL